MCNLVQVFLLTALGVREPVTHRENVLVNIARVAFNEEEVRGVLLFTQRNFFSDSVVVMLSEAAVISDSMTYSSFRASWSYGVTESSAQVVSDLCMCFEKAVDRRRFVKHTSEQWYATGAVDSLTRESSSQCLVGVSTIVEEKRIEHMPVSASTRNLPGPSQVRSSTRRDN